MKIKSPLLLLLASLGATSLVAEDINLKAIGDGNSGFYLGQSTFPKGDSIEITSVERFPDRLVVKGHYDLESADSAELALYTTTKTAVSVPTASTQLKHIYKGQGDFELIHPNLVPGMNHVTMYAISGGKPFAGVYFGTKDEATDESKLNLGYYAESSTDSTARSITAGGPNQALINYLGNPVEPPADMDAHYTAQGLTNAIQLAAGNAGITIKKVAIDDSEFPYLIGIVCGGADAGKLKSQIKKLDGYTYGGSIGNDSNSDGSDTCNVFSIVPDRAYPPGTSSQIYHRLWMRQQVFYDKMNQH